MQAEIARLFAVRAGRYYPWECVRTQSKFRCTLSTKSKMGRSLNVKYYIQVKAALQLDLTTSGMFLGDLRLADAPYALHALGRSSSTISREARSKVRRERDGLTLPTCSIVTRRGRSGGRDESEQSNSPRS